MTQQLSDVSISEMVESLATGIAEAQLELDLTSARVAEMMSGRYQNDEGQEVDARIKFQGENLSLLELGFSPAFYQFSETILEVKVSVSTSRESSYTTSKSMTEKTVNKKRHGFLGTDGSTTKTRVTTVSSRFSSRFQYSAEGASIIRTKMVSAPPPSIMEERMHELLEENKSR